MRGEWRDLPPSVTTEHTERRGRIHRVPNTCTDGRMHMPHGDEMTALRFPEKCSKESFLLCEREVGIAAGFPPLFSQERIVSLIKVAFPNVFDGIGVKTDKRGDVIRGHLQGDAHEDTLNASGLPCARRLPQESLHVFFCAVGEGGEWAWHVPMFY